MSKSLVRSIKNVANGYSSVQVLVRNATSNDAAGPSTLEMDEIAAYTYLFQTEFLEIMDMLDRRLNDKGKNWRHIAKSLTMLDYLVRFGLEKCVLWAKDNLYLIKTLREFIHVDEIGADQGAIIRVKAKELVSLLRDDERLKHERQLAKDLKSGRRRRAEPMAEDRPRPSRREREDTAATDSDEEFQRALELSRITAEEERRRLAALQDDPDLEAAIRLSKEEEELRKSRANQSVDLLDLSGPPAPQQYYVTGFYQPMQQDFYQVQQPQFTQQPQQQLDMFGNPIQVPFATGMYQPQSQPQFTGFHQQDPYLMQQFAQQPAAQELQPLQTGTNNPFAMNAPAAKPSNLAPSLLDISLQQQQQQQQELQYQQMLLRQQQLQAQQQAQKQAQLQAQAQTEVDPASLKPQNTSSSRFNDSTHSELNNLLAQGTGVDTFGNTGATRIPHQHTQTQTFVNSSGTGFKQNTGDRQKLSSNATGNPFLNTGVGYQGQDQFAPQRLANAPTGYGFGNGHPAGNAPPKESQSLIDI